MGHAHHFLSRLDRVSQDHVELALSLYNDPDLLRLILAECRAPDAERVAISLADPVEGPFVIVTRDGAFVTCLGEGMHVKVPVITRARLDAVVDRVEMLRERREMSKRLCPDERASTRLVERIYTAGEHLSREEFLALAAMQPMLWSKLLAGVEKSGEALADLHEALRGVDVRRPFKHDAEVLEIWWEASWSLKHMLLLIGLDAQRATLERLPAATLASMRRAFTHPATAVGLWPVMAAGAWSSARFDDAFLHLCQRRYREATTRADVVENAAALFALAGRSSYFRKAAQRALAPGEARAANDGPAREAHALKVQLDAALREAMQRGTDRLELDAAVAGATRFLEHRAATSRWNGWQALRDIPLDLARVALVDDVAPALSGGADPAQALRLLPAIARMRPEQFYLPAELLQKVREPQTSLRIRELMARMIPRDARPKAVVAGRNEPCPCASGKKYKKCCAVARNDARRGEPDDDLSLATCLRGRAA